MLIRTRQVAVGAITAIALLVAGACSGGPSDDQTEDSSSETSVLENNDPDSEASDEPADDNQASNDDEPWEVVPVTFQLNWVAGGFHAGFAVAVVDGIYEDAGLNVKIVEGNGSGTTAQLVASNQAGIAYADAVSVAQLVAKGAPMKVVSTIFQSSPSEIEALEETGISSISDLEGKSIGVPTGAAQTVMLPLLLAANGLTEADINEVNMAPASLAQALLQGNVDAILGSSDAYRIQLEREGASVDYFSYADNGVPTVSTSIFASDTFLERNPEVVKRFLSATLKGWNIAIDDPDQALEALKEIFPDHNADLAADELQASIDLMCKADAKYVGKAEPESWDRTQELLSSVGLLEEGVDATAYYTNDFLPADSELRPCPVD